MEYWNRGRWLYRLLCCLATSLSVTILCANDRKPNLIVIMADDLGYQDVGFNGCKDIPTPHIDRIAKEGIRFTSGYVSYSVCGPSRAGFMTGRYQQRFGFERNPQYRPNDPNMGLTRDETTIAESLKTVGYKSGIIGKWHLGAHDGHHPLERGFDEFFGHRGGGHHYFCDKLSIAGANKAKDEGQSYRTLIERQKEPVKTTGYLTDVFSQEAVEFIGRHKEEPFFLFLSYNAPHTPLQATETYLKRFPNIKDKKRRTYAAMVSAVDDGVGRVMEALKTHDVDKNTLIFFLSDNGGPERSNASNNGPLRGGKSDVWEGGFRVPFACRWSSKLKPGVYEQPVSSLDIFATIAGLSSAKTNPEKPLDGVNLIPFLDGSQKGKPHPTIYLRKFDQGRFAIRHGNLKTVILEKNGKPKLYDLSKDLGETKDLAIDKPDDVAKLETLRKDWNAQLTEPTFLGLIHRKKAGAGRKTSKKTQ